MGPDVVGLTVDAARESVVKANKKIVSAAYDNVDTLAKASGIASQEVGNIVPLKQTTDIAKREFKRWEAKPRETTLRKEMMDLYDSVLNGPAKTTVEDADQGLRSDLLKKARKLETDGTRSLDPVKTAAIDQLAQAAKADLSSALSKYDPAISTALDAARKAARENIEFEKLPFVRSLSKMVDDATPEKLIPAIFTDATPTKIDLAVKALGQQTVSDLADTWLHKTVEEAMTDQKSIGLSLRKKLDKMGRPSLEKVFSKTKVDDLYAMSKLYEREGAKFLEAKAVKGALSVADSNPTALGSKIFQADNTARLVQWKAELGPKTYNKVLASWVDESMKSGGLQKTLDDLGPKMLKEMFPSPKHLQDIMDIARIDGTLSKTSGGASVLAHIMEGGALLGMAQSPIKSLRAGSAGVIADLPIMGALLSHKASAKLLAQGVKNPKQFSMYLDKATAELLRYSKATAAEDRRRRSKRMGLNVSR